MSDLYPNRFTDTQIQKLALLYVHTLEAVEFDCHFDFLFCLLFASQCRLCSSLRS